MQKEEKKRKRRVGISLSPTYTHRCNSDRGGKEREAMKIIPASKKAH